MSDGGGRQLLDDEGRIFGVVNVVDALVVLLVLAVVVAGVVLLLPAPGEPDNRYVTLDLGEQPEFVAEEVGPGDTWEPEGTSDALTITDVYRFDTGDGTSIFARAQLNGTTVEPDEPDDDPVFEFLDDPLRIGQSFDLVTQEYEVSGNVTSVARSGDRLPLADSSFVVEASVSSQTAEEIDVGDEFTAGGEVFGEIEAFEAFPAEDGQSVLVGISATTIERGGSQFLGNTRLGVGTTLAFEGDGYTFEGDVVRRGSTEIPTEMREFVLETEVDAAVADDVRGGDEVHLGEEPLVTVEDVTVYATGDADVRRVVMGVSALTRLEGDTALFGDERVRVGSTLSLETEAYDVDAEVVRRGTIEEAGTPASRTATVKLENIPPERAAAISEGMAEQTRELTTAEVQNVSAQPAEVVLESEDGDIFLREHPRNKDVELAVELSVRELDDGTVRFRSERLRSGQPLALELGDLTIEGEVIGFE